MAVSALSKEPYGQPIVFELAGIEKGKIWGPAYRPDLAMQISRSALVPVKPFKNLTEESIVLPHKNLTQERLGLGSYWDSFD